MRIEIVDDDFQELSNGWKPANANNNENVNIDEIEKAMLANGDLKDFRRNWSWSDPLLSGTAGIIRQFRPSNIESDRIRSLIGLTDEEFIDAIHRGIVNRDEWPLGKMPLAERDLQLKTLLNRREAWGQGVEGLATAIDASPHKDPDGFLETAADFTLGAIPGLVDFAAKSAVLTPYGAMGLNTLQGNQQTKERVYSRLTPKVGGEEAFKSATEFTGNIADLGVRGATNAATMYMLGKTPTVGIGTPSPYAQVVRNIAEAAGISGAGAAAEEALTNYRSDDPINPLGLAKTAGKSALATAGIGAFNTARNWRDIKARQDLYHAINDNIFNAEYTEVPPDDTMLGGNSAPRDTPPESPINPLGGAEIVVAPEPTPAPNPFKDIMIQYGLNPESGIEGLKIAYRNKLINDFDLAYIVNKIAPENSVQAMESIKMDSANMPPLVKSENIPIENLLVPPSVSSGIRTNRPNVEKFTKGIPEPLSTQSYGLKKTPDNVLNLLKPLSETQPTTIKEDIDNPLLQPPAEQPQTQPIPNIWVDPLTTYKGKADITPKSKNIPVTPELMTTPETTSSKRKSKKAYKGSFINTPLRESLIEEFKDVPEILEMIKKSSNEALEAYFSRYTDAPAESQGPWQDPLKSNKTPEQTNTIKEPEAPKITTLGTTPAKTLPSQPEIQPKQTPVIQKEQIPLRKDSLLHQPEDDGYMGTINIAGVRDSYDADNEYVTHKGKKINDNHEISVYKNTVEDEAITEGYGNDYFDIVDENNNAERIAVYYPESDEFIITPQYSKTGWVRNIEDTLRKELGREKKKDPRDFDWDSEDNTPARSDYVGSISVPHMGKEHNSNVYIGQMNNGNDYLDIIADNGARIAWYNPDTDEFHIEDDFRETDWVKGLEDSFRSNLKPSEDIIEAAKNGELSDGLYDFFGFDFNNDDKDTEEHSSKQVNEQKTQETVAPIVPIGEQYKESKNPTTPSSKGNRKEDTIKVSNGEVAVHSTGGFVAPSESQKNNSSNINPLGTQSSKQDTPDEGKIKTQSESQMGNENINETTDDFLSKAKEADREIAKNNIRLSELNKFMQENRPDKSKNYITLAEQEKYFREEYAEVQRLERENEELQKKYSKYRTLYDIMRHDRDWGKFSVYDNPAENKKYTTFYVGHKKNENTLSIYARQKGTNWSYPAGVYDAKNNVLYLNGEYFEDKYNDYLIALGGERKKTHDKNFGQRLADKFIEHLKGQHVFIKPEIKDLKDYNSEATTPQRANVPTSTHENIHQQTQPSISEANTENNNDVTQQPTPISQDKITASQEIAKKIKDHILSGEEVMDNNSFHKMTSEIFGGTRGQGFHTVKDDYDAMEMGINQAIVESKINPSAANDKEAATTDLERLKKFTEHLPTQANRTEEQNEFQQFSTPPTLAYVANWLANIKAGDIVLEPSAGLGGLAVFAKNSGGRLILNELSKRRAELLESMGLGKVYRENAEQIANILIPKLKPINMLPDKVIMNPPFSSTAGRIAGQRNSSNAIRHVQQALELLRDGGRLVAILGRGTTSRKEWHDIEKEYNIRAAINIDGSNYRKYGTSYDNIIVVIDKTGATPEGGTIKGDFKNLEDIFEPLKEIRNSVPTPEVSVLKETTPVIKTEENLPTDTIENPKRSPAPKTNEPEQAQSKPTTSNTPKEKSGITKRQSTPATSKQSNTESKAPVKRRSISDIRAPKTTYKIKKKEKADIKKERLSDIFDEGKYLERAAEEEKTDDVQEISINTAYHSSISNGNPHPADLVETTALASTPLPPLTYEPMLPAEMIEEGKISDAQLEATAYAGQAFENKLSDGRAGGFFLGDGTGVGKGREIAAIIHDTLAHGYGNGKALWISKNADDLFEEAIDHWKDIGNDEADIFSQKEFGAKDNITRDTGVLFTAYSQITSPDRMLQVTKWLSQGNEEYDGIIVLDESHIGKNATESDNSDEGGWGKKDSSQTAKCILNLVNAYPKARILYSSATGATEITNYALYDRLGLWGTGTQFPTMNDFFTEINNGGLGAMELLVRDLKAMGRLVSRSISFRAGPYGGNEDVTFDVLDANMTDEEQDVYNRIGEAWQKVFQNITKALSLCKVEKGRGAGKTTKSKANPLMIFWGTELRVYNQLLTAMKAKALIKDIEKQLKSGNSAVVQLITTNEAELDRAISKKMQQLGLQKQSDIKNSSFYEGLEYSPHNSLIELVKECFPIYEIETREETSEDGRKHTITEVAKDSQGNPIINQQSLRLRDELLNDIQDVWFPPSAIDQIIEHFGVDNVAELTGRSKRIVTIDGKRVYQPRGKSARKADKQAFLDGRKRILIFSEAGSTGASYHAGNNFKNQQKRIHYILEPGWRAEIAIQSMGRTHRTNEAHKPHYVLMSTGIPGEKRFISSIARRILQLGALTSGERGNASKGIFSEKDNLENKHAKAAMAIILQRIAQSSEGWEILTQIGLDPDGIVNNSDKGMPQITRVFNRLLVLDIDTQKRIMTAFENELDNQILNAIANGTLDTRAENIKAESVKVIDHHVIKEYKEYGATTEYLKLELQQKTKPRTWKQLTTRTAWKSNSSGDPEPYTYDATDKLKFYKDENGYMVAVEQMSGSNNPDKCVVFHVDKRKREYSVMPYFENLVADAKHTYTEVPTHEAKGIWEKQISELPPLYPQTMHMIIGMELPIWEMLRGTNPSIKRVTTDSGDVFLGREISSRQIKDVLRRFNFKSGTSGLKTPKEIREYLDSGNKTLELSNGYKLKYSRVNGEKRLEIVGNIMSTTRSRWSRDYNAITEIIRGETRVFVPTNDDSLLDYLLEQYNVVNESDNNWEDFEANGVAEFNSAIPDENLNNLNAINPFFRKYFMKGWGTVPADIDPTEEANANNPYVRSKPVYKSQNPDIAKRMDSAANQIKNPKNLLHEVTTFAKEVYKNRSDVPGLTGQEKFTKAVNFIRELKQTRRANVQEIVHTFQIILDKLTPEDYELFSFSMQIADLVETYGMDEGTPLPFGYTPDELAKDYKNVQSWLGENEKVKSAIEKAEAFGEQIRKDIIKQADSLGLYDLRDKLKRKHYFRHLVLEYYMNTGGERVPRPTVKNPTSRGYTRQRKGSTKDISSNWVMAMGEVYVRMLDDTKIMATLSKLRDEYDVIETLKQHALSMNMENALKKIKSTLSDIDPEDLTSEATKELNKQLSETQSKAISKIFELAQNNDLPTGFTDEWNEFISKLVDAGQLERLMPEDRETFARYIGWLVNSKEIGTLTAKNEINTTAQKMAARILKSEAIKRAKLKKITGKDYVKWTDLIPNGLSIWSPTDTPLIFSASSVPEYAMQIAMGEIDNLLGIPLSEVGAALQTGGNKQLWVIPDELAEYLNKMGNKPALGRFGQINRMLMTGFKKWALLSPVRGRVWFYNLRNFLGDFEAVLQGNPLAIKYVPQAIKELKRYMYDGAIPTGKLAEFVKRGGALTTEFSSELQDWKNLREFQHLLEQKEGNIKLSEMPAKFVRGYVSTVSHFTNFREAILRYASFLSFIDLIEENGGKAPFYAMSKKEEVDAMTGDTFGMAFKLSNENLGAYDEISEDMQWLLRNSFMSFGAWLEVNFTRSMQMYSNILRGDDYLEYYFKKHGKKLLKVISGNGSNGGGKKPPENDGINGADEPPEDNGEGDWGNTRSKSLRKRLAEMLKHSPVMGARYIKVLAMMFPLALAASLFNKTFFSKEDEELPPDTPPHIIIGKNSLSNEILYLSRVGSAFDFLEIDPSTILVRNAREILNGRQTIGGLLSDLVSNPLNRVLNNANPFLKMAIERITGTKTYPDYRDRTQIRDYGRYIAQSLNLDWYYDFATGKPHKPFTDFKPSVVNTLKTDGSASYFYIQGRKRQFQEQVLHKRTSMNVESERSDALRDAQWAISLGDKKGLANAFKKYFIAGETPEGMNASLRARHPLFGLNKTEQAQFIKWLSKEDREHLKKAQRYHLLLEAYLKQ